MSVTARLALLALLWMCVLKGVPPMISTSGDYSVDFIGDPLSHEESESVAQAAAEGAASKVRQLGRETVGQAGATHDPE